MLKEGQVLEGKYKLGRLLGRGGMGSVFLGEHTKIKRAVAIKVLHEEKADSENTQRFEREAEAAGRIGSDHIVEVLDFGTTPDGDRFMVMEYLDGETLKERLKRVRRFEPIDIVPIVAQMLEGLAAAHAVGIVHRDLKPDNVFIAKTKAGRADFVKIVDFGISKFNALTGEVGMMTQTGAVMGTPYYMSPEQARATNEVDARSDLYSVGVLLYETVTGAVPFNGTTLTELMFKIVFEEPPHPQSLVPSLDSDFVAIVLKAMAREPARRFQDAAQMQTALVAWARDRASGRAPNVASAARPGAEARKTAPMPAAGAIGAAPPQPPTPSSPRLAVPQHEPTQLLAIGQGPLAMAPRPNAPHAHGATVVQPPTHAAPPTVLDALPRPPPMAKTAPYPMTNGPAPGEIAAATQAFTATPMATAHVAPPHPAPKRGAAIAIAIGVGVVVLGAAAAGLFALRGGDRGAAANAPASATPATATASAPTTSAATPAPSDGASAPAATSTPPAPAVAASAVPDATPPAEIERQTPRANDGPRPGRPPVTTTHAGARAPVAPPPSKPAEPPPPAPHPTAAGTVKDFGY